MDRFKTQLAKLIDVKSITTFSVVGLFVYLGAKGEIPADNVMLVVTTIITFFFAKPSKKE